MSSIFLFMRDIFLEKFEGPLDLLLQLIEKDKLNITEISLAKITDQYLAYIHEKVIASEEVADFLLIAAKLIYLKSKYLLPNFVAQEEDDGLSLAKQLKIYRQYYDASKLINKMWLDKNHLAYQRNVDLKAYLEFGFLPPKNVKTQNLHDYFQAVLARIETIVNLPKVVMARAISIGEKIKQIKDLINQKQNLLFSHLKPANNNKTEVIVNFLAILELVKQKEIVVQQSDLFADFNIFKK